MHTPTEPDPRCTCGAAMDYAGALGWNCVRGFKCPDVGFVFVTERPDWDTYYLNGAKWAATRADCRRAQHGALIVDPQHRVVSQGYNGYPSGVRGCLSGGCPRGSVPPSQLPHRAPYNEGVGRCDAVHAEANAIIRAPWSAMQGATIYITGQPCHGCEVLIKGSGLIRMVWPGASIYKGSVGW